MVAPHVGAWIETSLVFASSAALRSHPMWVRGLKPINTDVCQIKLRVAPHVGAWIETPFAQSAQYRAAGRTPCGCVD